MIHSYTKPLALPGEAYLSLSPRGGLCHVP